MSDSKPAAAFHPGTGPTPRGAADVLREHRVYGGSSYDAYGVTCSCDPHAPFMGHGRTGYDAHSAHVADMLAAAGLLATAEHDQEIAAHAAQAAEEVLVAVATATDRQIVGDDVWQHTTLEIAQNAGSVIEAVNDALLDYRDGWAIDEAERRAAGEQP